MSPLLSTYLLSLRKRSGLSQSDLALLLGIDGSALCKFESLSRRPTIELAIGAEVIFGQPMKDVFPAFYCEIERAIVDRARMRRDRCKARPESATAAELRALDDVIERARQTTLGL